MASTISSSVCDLFKQQIRTGKLKAGEAFPSIRVVAAQHKMAHATAVRVIDQLIAEGYLERIGKRPAIVLGDVKKSLLVGIVYSASEAKLRHPGTIKSFYALSETHLAHGHRVQLLPITPGDWSSVSSFAKDLPSSRMGGLVIMGWAGTGPDNGSESLTVALRDIGMPVVQWGSHLNPMSAIWPLVAPDFNDLAAQAVDLFRQHDRCRIGVIAGPYAMLDSPYSIPHGIRARLGSTWDESCYERVTDWSEASGREAACRLLDKGSFNAILCEDDINALGVLRELKARDLRAPNDIALIGVGDLLLDQMNTSLSTFDLRYDHLAAQTARLLERQAEGESLVGLELRIPSQYIARKTFPERLPEGHLV